MMTSWKMMLAGLLAAVALAGVPKSVLAAAPCGDMDNSGTANATDCLVLAQCLAGGGVCPTVSTPGPLCGTGNLIDCGDLFGDGSVSIANLAADLAVCIDSGAGLPTLYDRCKGPGPAIACPGGTAILNSQTISTSQTWPASCKVQLNGTVFISTPPLAQTTVITLQPGSRVEGVVGSPDPATLVFLPGSHIDAQGTPSQPIVMTSSNPPGSRSTGDWAGLMLNGKSTVNRQVEGPCTADAEGIPAVFGGCIENDSSGVMRYVRVEFCGLDFTPNNELNTVTMNALGSGTSMSFVQGHAGGDDCLEWFGGTMSGNHLIASGCGDDGFDYQLGSTINIQYGLQLQNGSLTDPGRDSRGIEADNSEFDNEALPRSNPNFCNMTLVGSNKQPGANDGSDVGVFLRRGTAGKFANMIVQDYNDAGAEMRDVSTTQQACVDANADKIPESLTGNLIVRNSVFFDNGGSAVHGAATEQAKDNDGVLDTTAGVETGACTAAGCNCDTEAWYALLVSGFNVVPSNGANPADPGISDQYPALDAVSNAACTGLRTPFACCTSAGVGSCRALFDPRPTNLASFPSAFNCKNLSPKFDTTTYIGAVNPAASCTTTGGSAACDWLTKPWVDFAIN